jgi:lambda repressor-like predicted transcriptional regulator
MHPADIKAALQKKGSSLAKVAQTLDVSAPTVSQVISGRTTSRRIAAEVARQTGVSLTRLFPRGRYDDRHAA